MSTLICVRAMSVHTGRYSSSQVGDHSGFLARKSLPHIHYVFQTNRPLHPTNNYNDRNCRTYDQ